MTLLFSKKCLQCRVIFEGLDVGDMHTCTECGYEYLKLMPLIDTDEEVDDDDA